MKATAISYKASATRRFEWDKDEAPRMKYDGNEIAVTGLLIKLTSGGNTFFWWGGYKIKKDGTVGGSKVKGQHLSMIDNPWLKELVEDIPRPVATVHT